MCVFLSQDTQSRVRTHIHTRAHAHSQLAADVIDKEQLPQVHLHMRAYPHTVSTHTYTHILCRPCAAVMLILDVSFQS